MSADNRASLTARFAQIDKEVKREQIRAGLILSCLIVILISLLVVVAMIIRNL